MAPATDGGTHFLIRLIIQVLIGERAEEDMSR